MVISIFMLILADICFQFKYFKILYQGTNPFIRDIDTDVSVVKDFPYSHNLIIDNVDKVQLRLNQKSSDWV